MDTRTPSTRSILVSLDKFESKQSMTSESRFQLIQSGENKENTVDMATYITTPMPKELIHLMASYLYLGGSNTKDMIISRQVNQGSPSIRYNDDFLSAIAFLGLHDRTMPGLEASVLHTTYHVRYEASENFATSEKSYVLEPAYTYKLYYFDKSLKNLPLALEYHQAAKEYYQPDQKYSNSIVVINMKKDTTYVYNSSHRRRLVKNDPPPAGNQQEPVFFDPNAGIPTIPTHEHPKSHHRRRRGPCN